MEQLGSHRTYFREILYGDMLKSVAKIQISFKETELRVSRIIHEDADILVTSYLILQGMKGFNKSCRE
jgi:hypothetical protein